MQRSLMMDKHFVEPGFSFHVDLLLAVFVVGMTLLFFLFGMILSPASFVPVNYEIFW